MRAVMVGPHDTHHETQLDERHPLLEYKGGWYDYVGTTDGAWHYRLRVR